LYDCDNPCPGGGTWNDSICTCVNGSGGTTGFPGFITLKPYLYAVLTDVDTCTFGPNPAPDGGVSFMSVGGGMGKCISASNNYSYIYSIGSIYNVIGLYGSFPFVKSDTNASAGSSSACNNPGNLVVLDLSVPLF
jgi:hypothetical protein